MLSLAAGPLSGSPADAGSYGAPPRALPLRWGAVGPQRWRPQCDRHSRHGERWQQRLSQCLLLRSLRLDLGKHLCFLPLWGFSVAALGSKAISSMPATSLTGSREVEKVGMDWLNVDLQSPWERGVAQAAVFISVSSWHSKLYQSIAKNGSSPDPEEIQL